MKKYKHLLISSLLVLLPCLFGLALWDQLPDQMPTHFGPGGVDGWSSKGFAVFGLPLLILFFHIVVWLATLLDKQNQTGSKRKILNMILYIFPMISIVTSCIIYGIACGQTTNASNLMLRLLPVLMGLLFIVIGNYLPKCRINGTLGIKLPWTFHNEENWNKTHRMAGPLWVIGGLAQIIGGLLGWTWVFLVVVFPMILVPTFYSYLLYKKQIASGAYEPGNPKISMSTKMGRVSGVFVLAVTLLVVFLLCSGSLEYTIEESFLHIEASYQPDLTVDLRQVDTIEFEEKAMDGSRVWGFASAKLAMGTFENDSLGTYARYTYTRCKAYILLTVDGQYLVLNAGTPEETQALYQQILNAMPVLQ
jgi:uncharacterized membrane protein